MSFNLNNVQLAGHLTRDPQVKSLANERTVADFGLAINRRFKGADGEFKEESTFVEVEAWGRTAELIGQYLTKGSPCYLEGRLRLDSWQDKDGAKRSKIKVLADNVQFLSRPRSAGGADHTEGEPAHAGKTAPAGARAMPAGEAIDQPPF